MREQLGDLPDSNDVQPRTGDKRETFKLLQDVGDLNLSQYKDRLMELGVSAEVIAEIAKFVDELVSSISAQSGESVEDKKFMEAVVLEKGGRKYLRLDIAYQRSTIMIDMANNSVEFGEKPKGSGNLGNWRSHIPTDTGGRTAASGLDYYDNRQDDPKNK